MGTRPRIKLELTNYDRLFETLGWSILLTLWIFTVTNYYNLPETIPTHFNGAGHIDSFGSKFTIFLLPIIGTILFIGMTLLNNFPHIFNYPTNITADNALEQYTNATKLIRYLKLILVVIFTIITYMIIRTTKGLSDGLGVWFLPLTLGLIFIPVIYYTIKSIKNYKL
ncbi:MAG: DUF1648 domain-containing protein [bacterium]